MLDCVHKTPKPASSGYPYIAIPNIKSGRLDLKDVRLISEKDYQEWTKKTTPRAGDIILTRRARVGDIAVVPEGLKCAIGQNLVILRSNEKQVLQRYLKWALRGPLYEQEMYKYLNVGAVFDSLNCKDIPKFEIPIPTIPEQNAISDILDSLDDKIDLNNQMNKTLEQIAQTLFKRWFIDFELPDENGNPYKSSGGRMVDSELGKIPEGWKVGNILDFADLLSGGTPKTSISEYWDGGIPWVSAKDVTSSNGTFILTTEKTITQKGIEKSNAKLLPKLTTVVTARGTVGNVCILSKEMAINQTNYGLKSKHDHGDFFLFITLLNLIQDMKQNAYGTVFDTITTKTFRQIQIILPPMKFIVSFDSIIGDLMHKVMSNLEESQNLSLIRDSLLPKLMSGKIRV